MFHNPAYNQATPLPLPPTTSGTIPSTFYSSQGPGDTPTSHTLRTAPPQTQEQGERVYEVLEQVNEEGIECQEREEERLYHVLEEGKPEVRDDGGTAYEVPIQSKFSRKRREAT